jgi:protein phosphatase
MSFALRYAVRSDRGLIRGNNQDSVYAGPHLLAIADGMGGYAGGEVASKVMITALARVDEDTPGADLLTALRQATEAGNQHLRELVREDPALDGMGTTLTALLFASSRLGIVHVGDSRCYLLRDDELSQITHDHTFVQALVDEGRLTQEEAGNHPQRSLLLRALNGGEVEPDLSVRESRIGDRYLLCSDGLTSVVSAETLADTLRIRRPQDCADRLVELALRSGGPDNITVIVADVIDDQYGDDVPVVDGAAGMNNGRREVAPTSAAARAAIAAPTHRKPEPEPMASPPPRPRRRTRRVVLAAILLLALAGGGYGLWRWTQTQFFVGVSSDQVAIYQGINASVGPVHLYRLASASDLAVADLQQVARDKLDDGSLTANSKQGAESIVERLRRDNLLPECPRPSATPSRSPRTTVPSTRSAPAPSGRSARPAPNQPVPITGSPTSITNSPTSTLATPTETPVPGKDCRVVG